MNETFLQGEIFGKDAYPTLKKQNSLRPLKAWTKSVRLRLRWEALITIS